MAAFDLNVQPIDCGENDDALAIDLNQYIGWDDNQQDEPEDVAAAGEVEGNGAVVHGQRGHIRDPERHKVDAGHLEKYCPETNQVRRRKQYTDKQRRAIYTMLLERTSLGILKRGTTKSLSLEIDVGQRVIQRIWLDGKRGGGIHAVDSKKPKNCGRKRVAFDVDMIKDVPLSRRKNLHDLAAELGVSRTTLHRRLKERNIGKEWWSSV